MNPAAVLADLKLRLPLSPKPVAAYVPVRRSGDLLYVSGQIPMRDGKAVALGTVPTSVSLEQARECAVQCTLNGLAAVAAFLQIEQTGSYDPSVAPDANLLSRIRQVIRIGCFVACTSEFADHPKVANAASELLKNIFGPAGEHARAAVGAPSLPLGVPVEIEYLFEVPKS